MNSGVDTSARGALTVAAALSLLFSTSLPTQAQRAATVPQWNLPALMTTLRQVRGSTAHFDETRYLHLLSQPQRSSGRLIYVAPDRLQKETLEPTASRMTIIGDRLTIERPGGSPREMSMRDNAAVGALVESVRATLAGDLPALTRYFLVTLDGGPDNWSLGLVPREGSLRELIATIRIQGGRDAIREIDTAAANGDRTDTVITPDPK